MRRNSILRASGHTFEYLGYGPGNYSTALPERINRDLSKAEELLSQSTKQNAGVVVYTAMNSDGDFYIGNKKVSSATGQEEVFDAPVPTVTGEDIAATGVSVGFDVLSPQEVSISRSLRVEGGADNNILSEFDGPVVFNKKLTSTASDGIEANHLFLQGDATVSRKYTVGIATPSLAGNPGDVEYNATPEKGGHLGWVYTNENDWYSFGNVSLESGVNVGIFDRVGVGTTTYAGLGTAITFKVGSGSSEFHVDGTGNVGIATTNTKDYKLYVDGNIYGKFYGDGSNISNLSSIWEADSSDTWIYDKDKADHKVGIGTTQGITAQLEVAGTAATSLYVTNEARFISTAHFQSEVSIGGTLTSTDYSLIGSSSADSRIFAGVSTSLVMNVGVAGTVLNASTTSAKVGVGTSAARSLLDVEGAMRSNAYHQPVGIVTSVSGVVTLDMAISQSFTLSVNEAVTQFTVKNIPDYASSFTLKTTQDSTGGYSVDIDTFKDADSTAVPVYWPGGGVLPGVTTTPSRSDIYSFQTFDGGSSLFGVVGGQNFL